VCVAWRLFEAECLKWRWGFVGFGVVLGWFGRWMVEGYGFLLEFWQGSGLAFKFGIFDWLGEAVSF